MVDVRAFPRSRTNPQFNIETLPQALADAGIDYRHAPALGGRRPKQTLGFASPNGGWRNDSFRNFADYALTPPFSAALADLLALARARPCAILCAEAAWQRCHRRIIADWLLAAGADVRHILDHGRIVAAERDPLARVQPDGAVHYPPAQGRLL